MKFTFAQFNQMFETELDCLKHLFNSFYAHKACPCCGKVGNYYKVKKRKVYACSCGKHQLCPTADTIFHKSRTALKTWFYVIYMFSQSKNGVSAKEVERVTGVTYKTAWRMCKQVRLLMDSDRNFKFMGTVEVDETYVGGKGTGKRGRGAENKTPVVGVVERNGDVRAYVTTNVKSSTVLPIIRDNVELGANVMTDEYNVYNRVESEGYVHDTIQHKAKKYVFGDVHTNTIEGFWGQLKRGIDGTYHAVSPKYLQSYVNEFSFRYNQRNSSEHLFHALVGRIA